MIIITTTNGFKLKYYGNITIHFHDRLITVYSQSDYPRINENELTVWASETYDWLFPHEIVSIEGRDE